MPDALLTLLKWCLLALVYVFFFRVVQATWFASTGQRIARGAKTTSTSRVMATTPPAIAVAQQVVMLEPAELAGRAFAIGAELTIGRSASCSITLDDTYVSQVHAKLYHSDSGVVLDDLGSTNGTYLNRQRVVAPVAVAIGDKVQVGSVVMEVR